MGNACAILYGIYVASRASVPERAAMWRALRADGARIVSSWIDEDGEGQTDCFMELWTRIEREVQSCRQLVLYVEPGDFPLRGALVEVGMALAMGRPVVIVAPGVAIEDRTNRPIGSWAAHPLVSFSGDVRQAVGLPGIGIWSARQCSR